MDKNQNYQPAHDKLTFSLSLNGLIDPIGDTSVENNPPMTAAELGENLQAIVDAAIANGEITHFSAGTLEEHQCEVRVECLGTGGGASHDRPLPQDQHFTTTSQPVQHDARSSREQFEAWLATCPTDYTTIENFDGYAYSFTFREVPNKSAEDAADKKDTRSTRGEFEAWLTTCPTEYGLIADYWGDSAYDFTCLDEGETSVEDGAQIGMHAETYGRQLQAELGWTDTTLLAVCLNYLTNRAESNDFTSYLVEMADNEREAPKVE